MVSSHNQAEQDDCHNDVKGLPVMIAVHTVSGQCCDQAKHQHGNQRDNFLHNPFLIAVNQFKDTCNNNDYKQYIYPYSVHFVFFLSPSPSFPILIVWYLWYHPSPADIYRHFPPEASAGLSSRNFHGISPFRPW